MLYSRLSLFKSIAVKIVAEGPGRLNSTAHSLGLSSQVDLAQFGDREPTAEHYYELFLESCERLFDNEIEQHAFEDQMRLMFGTKVCNTLRSAESSSDFLWYRKLSRPSLLIN